MTTLLQALTRTTVVAVATGSVLLGFGAAGTAHAHDGHEHGASAREQASPMPDHPDGPGAGRDYAALWDAATSAERRAATGLIEATRAARTRWQDVDAALADGFVPGRAGVGPVHYANRANRRDDGILDPARPEALVYLQRPNGDPILLGAVYTVNRLQDRPTPAGALAAWHVHNVPGCHHPDLDAGCGDVRGGMLHVWTYPGVRDPFADPMFASMGSPAAWRSKLFELAGATRRT